MQEIKASILYHLVVSTCLIIFLLPLQDAGAEEKPELELGIGVGGMSLPHYRGADQREDMLLPIPYVSYEGKRLKVNREGGQFYFFQNPRFRLNLSAALYPSVDTEDNRAREGMPDLDPVFEIGPRAELVLYESEDEKVQVRLGLPFRQAFASDIGNTKEIGWLFSPYLQWRYQNEWYASFSVGPMWATEEYHDYYYEVSPQYAAADRPAYNASEGYSGTRITFSSSRRFKRWWAGVFARYDTLSNAVFEESPLVKRDDSFMVGFGVATILWEWDGGRSRNEP